jgi:hypothetical protein
MIVKRVWITRKYDRIGSIHYLKEVRYWNGIFFLGFFPLYIENYKTEYVR